MVFGGARLAKTKPSVEIESVDKEFKPYASQTAEVGKAFAHMLGGQF
jgi:hypothetical protein